MSEQTVAWRSLRGVVLGREVSPRREAYLVRLPISVSVRLVPRFAFYIGWATRGHVSYGWDICA